MEKDFASLLLGIVAVFFIFLFGQDAYFSVVILTILCAIISIVFGVISMRSEGRKKYYLSGIGLSMMSLFFYAFPKFF